MPDAGPTECKGPDPRGPLRAAPDPGRRSGGVIRGQADNGTAPPAAPTGLRRPGGGREAPDDRPRPAGPGRPRQGRRPAQAPSRTTRPPSTGTTPISASASPPPGSGLSQAGPEGRSRRRGGGGRRRGHRRQRLPDDVPRRAAGRARRADPACAAATARVVALFPLLHGLDVAWRGPAGEGMAAYADHLQATRDRWDAYHFGGGDARVQLPWELAINGLVFQRDASAPGRRLARALSASARHGR
ncbi:hypothetical protein ACRAWD_06645 [Caulobacter segnis]